MAKITYRSVFSLIFARKRFKNRFKILILNLRFFNTLGSFLNQIIIHISSDFLHNTKSSHLLIIYFTSFLPLRRLADYSSASTIRKFVLLGDSPGYHTSFLQSVRTLGGHSWLPHLRKTYSSHNGSVFRCDR